MKFTIEHFNQLKFEDLNTENLQLILKKFPRSTCTQEMLSKIESVEIQIKKDKINLLLKDCFQQEERFQLQDYKKMREHFYNHFLNNEYQIHDIFKYIENYQIAKDSCLDFMSESSNFLVIFNDPYYLTDNKKAVYIRKIKTIDDILEVFKEDFNESFIENSVLENNDEILERSYKKFLYKNNINYKNLIDELHDLNFLDSSNFQTKPKQVPPTTENLLSNFFQKINPFKPKKFIP